MKNVVLSIVILVLIIIGVIIEYWHDKKQGKQLMDGLGYSWIIAGLIAFIVAFVMVASTWNVHAHDHEHPNLDKWYENLRNDNGGRCCNGEEIDTGVARRIANEDWEVKDGHYRVRLNGEWRDVPDWAVVTKPNLDGRTLVWIFGNNIQCFLPGAGM